KQCVGRNRGPHFNGADCAWRQRRASNNAEQVADALQGRILILLGVFREKLACMEAAIRRTTDNVGERAAPVDPEIPAPALCCLLTHARKLPQAPRSGKREDGKPCISARASYDFAGAK